MYLTAICMLSAVNNVFISSVTSVEQAKTCIFQLDSKAHESGL